MKQRWPVNIHNSNDVNDINAVSGWLQELDQNSDEQVVAALELLHELGPGLGPPLVDSVTGSRHKNMKELRPGSSPRSELRVLFAFDPERRAILLLAGDKVGNWQKWHLASISAANDLLDRHLKDLRDRKRHGRHAE